MRLTGKRIAVTRAAHQFGELSDLLRVRGAEPLAYPCISIAPPEDTSLLDAALRDMKTFDWLVLTSSNTVEALRQQCDALGLSLRGVPTAAVGPATAEAARHVLGVDVQVVPDEHVAESLAEAVAPTPGARIFLPQADLARSTLADQLAAAGAEVTVVTAYRTVLGQGGVNLPALLGDGAVDALMFTSSSTVNNCAIRIEQEGGDGTLLRGVVVFCIGPKTAAAAHEVGFRQVVAAEDYTLFGLVTAMEAHFGSV